MNEIYNKVLDAMDEGLLTFMKKVPEPQKEPFKNHFVYRYAEESIHQAIILKLVRLISGLRAHRITGTAWDLFRNRRLCSACLMK